MTRSTSSDQPRLYPLWLNLLYFALAIIWLAGWACLFVQTDRAYHATAEVRPADMLRKSP